MCPLYRLYIRETVIIINNYGSHIYSLLPLKLCFFSHTYLHSFFSTLGPVVWQCVWSRQQYRVSCLQLHLRLRGLLRRRQLDGNVRDRHHHHRALFRNPRLVLHADCRSIRRSQKSYDISRKSPLELCYLGIIPIYTHECPILDFLEVVCVLLPFMHGFFIFVEMMCDVIA
jgi:hypothetical protein